MIITMLSRQPLALEFRRWAVGVLKAYRNGALTTAPPSRLRGTMEVDPDEYIGLLKTKIAHLEGDLAEKRRRPAPVPLSDDVSIHSQPCDREKPAAPGSIIGLGYVSIHSQPCDREKLHRAKRWSNQEK